MKISILIPILLLATISSFAQMITIDTTIRYQTIQGWESGTSIVSSPGFNIATDTMAPIIKDSVARVLVNQIGTTRARLEVRAGSENTDDYWTNYIQETIPYEEWRANRYATVNDNNDPTILNMDGFHFSELDVKINNGILPLRKALADRGESLYINLCYVAFTGQITDGEFHHRDPLEYAEMILATFKYMDENYGFVPDAVEVILEPDVSNFGDGELVASCMVAAGDLLKANSYTPDFIALSNTNLNNAISNRFLGKFLENDRVSEYWSEFSYHAYAGRTTENLDSIAAIAKRNNVRTSMLEWWNNSNSFHRLHEDLLYGNNSAWEFKYSLVSPEANNSYGHTTINVVSKDEYYINIHPTVKYISQYYKNIRPGHQRVHAESKGDWLSPLAFRDSLGRYTVIIKCDQAADVSVFGLPDGTYTATYTTGNGKSEPAEFEAFANTGNIDGMTNPFFDTDIPAAGILLIRSNNISSIIENAQNSNCDFTISQTDEGIFKISSSVKNINYKIYNYSGAALITGQGTIADLSSLPKGHYFIDINQGQCILPIMK